MLTILYANSAVQYNCTSALPFVELQVVSDNISTRNEVEMYKQTNVFVCLLGCSPDRL